MPRAIAVDARIEAVWPTLRTLAAEPWDEDGAGASGTVDDGPWAVVGGAETSGDAAAPEGAGRDCWRSVGNIMLLSGVYYTRRAVFCVIIRKTTMKEEDKYCQEGYCSKTDRTTDDDDLLTARWIRIRLLLRPGKNRRERPADANAFAPPPRVQTTHGEKWK